MECPAEDIDMDLGDLPDGPEMEDILDNAERFIEDASQSLEELLSRSEDLDDEGM